MATTWIERQVLCQLEGHVSQVGIDIVRHQMCPKKGVRGCLRKNGLLEEMKPVRSFDEEALNALPSLGAVATLTGNCVHCMQDACVGLFDPSGDRSMYVVAVDNCELHAFKGNCMAECVSQKGANVFTKLFGATEHSTSRERLPFAFVSLDDGLLAACQQQLIRQTTKPDRGALGDCYAVGVRSIEGMRDNHQRVLELRLHVIMAARMLWQPNSITRVFDWVPTLPLGPDGVYRRDIYLNHLSKLRKELIYCQWTLSLPPLHSALTVSGWKAWLQEHFARIGTKPWSTPPNVFIPY